ncbi:MAG: tetratricopeptide repeat protein, partial [Acidobacteria bacterium]
MNALLVLLLLFAAPGTQQEDPNARFVRAHELQGKGALDEAATEYRALLATHPEFAQAHANLGVILARQGKYQEAVAEYKEALRLAPELTPILLNLGILHFRANEFAEAV